MKQSKYRGVYKNPSGTWYAQYTNKDGKRKQIGSFSNEHLAFLAFCMSNIKKYDALIENDSILKPYIKTKAIQKNRKRYNKILKGNGG